MQKDIIGYKWWSYAGLSPVGLLAFSEHFLGEQFQWVVTDLVQPLTGGSPCQLTTKRYILIEHLVSWIIYNYRIHLVIAWLFYSISRYRYNIWTLLLYNLALWFLRFYNLFWFIFFKQRNSYFPTQNNLIYFPDLGCMWGHKFVGSQMIRPWVTLVTWAENPRNEKLLYQTIKYL